MLEKKNTEEADRERVWSTIAVGSLFLQVRKKNL